MKRFLDTITPVLEHRLAHSEFAQYSDTLRISWYRAAVDLVFAQGKVERITVIQREDVKEAHVSVPFPTIYQLFMGYRTIDELHLIFPDAGAQPLYLPIVRVLFPKIRAQLTPEF